MTSPFAPTEQGAIVAAGVVAVLLAFWNIFHGLRMHDGLIRYAPFGLAVLLLSFSFVAFVVIYATPFLLRFPEGVVAAPAVGFLACGLAFALDQKFRGASEIKRPVGKATHVWESHQPRPTSFLRYYTSSTPVSIESRYDAEQSLARVLNLNGRGEIRVWARKDGRLFAVGAQWVRSTVLQVFQGYFEEKDGRTVLCGEIRVDRGISATLLLFCVLILVLFPLRAGTLMAESGMLGLLWFFYLIGKDDANKIVSKLQGALNERPTR